MIQTGKSSVLIVTSVLEPSPLTMTYPVFLYKMKQIFKKNEANDESSLFSILEISVA